MSRATTATRARAVQWCANVLRNALNEGPECPVAEDQERAFWQEVSRAVERMEVRAADLRLKARYEGRTGY